MMTSLGLTFKGVKDPRARRGQRHPLAAMLTLLVQALAVGRRVLRRAEALGEDMLREGTAPEGLRRPVSDTTLDRLLMSVEPEGLEQEVHQVVWRGMQKGLICHDLFSRGVVSIDGKAGESTPGQAPCEPSHTTKDEQGREYWYPYALRASLTSSAAQPVLDQKLLEGKQGEATAFPELFKRVVEKASLASSRVLKLRVWTSSIFKLLKKLSTTALSQQLPLRLIEQVMPLSASRFR